MSKCLIIAEAGVNHNGKLDLALKLCDAAKESGADVVKFQTWKTELLLTGCVSQASYQKRNTGREESQYDMLKRLELSFQLFETIRKYCDEIGIRFASTADDPESLDFLLTQNMPFLKVGSGDIGNVSFLRKIGEKGMPVILSTGMSTTEDVQLSVDALTEAGCNDLTLLHCTTSYPCSYGDVNLRAMLTLKEHFHFPVGYSDHTIGAEVAVAAVALGANVIEKHLTLDRTMEGPDHAASTEPTAFREMVTQIRNVEESMGDGKKRPTEHEKKIAGVVTKRIVTCQPIKKGEKFTEQNICVKRHDVGEAASRWGDVIGRVSVKDYTTDEGVVL